MNIASKGATVQKTELSDILLRHKDSFFEKYQLCLAQSKVYEAIITCRTQVLGGHADKCSKCDHVRCSYNSCRDRHCPKCQFLKQLQWADKVKSNLPPTKCFHLVFTIPKCFHRIFYINQAMAYGLLFRSAAQALKNCASNPKFLGAEVGAVAILHTWGQALTYHPHIHMIVPAGGLSEDSMEWVVSNPKFLLPVKVLSGVFRGILCRLMEAAVEKGQVKLPDGVDGFWQIKQKAYQKNWVVYAEKPFAGPENVVEYLARYSHRVAISNQRIVGQDNNGKVTFHYKDYRKGGLARKMTMHAHEFIRRFMMHVLPKRFYKVRYFGFMAQCNGKTKLRDCFALINSESFFPVFEGLTAMEIWREFTGKHPLECPVCGSNAMMPFVTWQKKEKTPT